MDIKYNVVKLKGNSTEEIKDSISVEEPLEMNLKYKVDGKWETEQLSITKGIFFLKSIDLKLLQKLKQ